MRATWAFKEQKEIHWVWSAASRQTHEIRRGDGGEGGRGWTLKGPMNCGEEPGLSFSSGDTREHHGTLSSGEAGSALCFGKTTEAAGPGAEQGGGQAKMGCGEKRSLDHSGQWGGRRRVKMEIPER